MPSTFGAPTSQFSSPPGSGAAGQVAQVQPWKTTAGYWIFLPLAATPPTGAVLGAVVRSGGGYLTLLTSTTVGLRIMRTPRGLLLFS